MFFLAEFSLEFQYSSNTLLPFGWDSYCCKLRGGKMSSSLLMFTLPLCPPQLICVVGKKTFKWRKNMIASLTPPSCNLEKTKQKNQKMFLLCECCLQTVWERTILPLWCFRALQELLIRYRPESSVSVLGSAGSVSHDGTSECRTFSDSHCQRCQCKYVSWSVEGWPASQLAVAQN